MLKSLSIENFRCFKKFDLNPLGRINLLVGKNNSGKISILEATQVLCSGRNLEPLKNIMMRRGDVNEITDVLELEASHLFHNYEMHDRSSICLQGLNDADEFLDLSITFFEKMFLPRPFFDKNDFNQNLEHFIERGKELGYVNSDKLKSFSGGNIVDAMSDILKQSSPDLLWEFFENFFSSSPVLDFQGKAGYSLDKQPTERDEFNYSIPFSANGGLVPNSLPSSVDRSPLPILFVSLPRLELSNMLLYFEEIVLDPEEEIVQEALRIIEPDLERIAIANNRKFFAKFANQSRKVSLSNLGEGARYLLGLILALVQVPNGILLVDNIDTGFTAP